MLRNYVVWLAILFSLSVANAAANAPNHAWTWWRTRNMRNCAGRPDQVKFDGRRSTISLSKDRPCTLVRNINYADLARDTFVMRFGKVSPGVKWQVWGNCPGGRDRMWRTLLTGTGGGTYRIPLSNLGYPRWLSANIDLRLSSDKPATVEILSWEIEKPGVDPWVELREKSYKQLAKANPMERGLVPYWNPNIPGFVCTFNTTHCERYNFWLEDEGEMLWGMGNYPDMMKLYGKALRDFIVRNCKHGAPVRRVNDQPLIEYDLPAGGKFQYDTGILLVEGDLSNDPHLKLHHSTYEMFVIATLAAFYVTYEDSLGVAHRVDFAKPRSYDVRYNAPKQDQAQLRIRAVDGQVAAAFTVVGYRGGVRISANVVNLGDSEISKVTAGFGLRDCEKYYRSPLNRLSQFGDVAILWSEQPRLEFCNFVRLAGPAAREPSLERKGDNIVRAGFAAEVSERLAARLGASLELANVQAASRSFAEKIEIYKDIDFEDADVSIPFVSTYALLGLATYSYRYPEDKEAREVVDLITNNFFGARERLRNRELGYLMWVLSLLGRDADANVVADLLEKRAATEKYTPHDMGGMAIGLRKVGRWDAADRVCKNLDKAWDGVAAPADVLGLGAQRSPELKTRCLKQLSQCLRQMDWEPHYPATFPANAMIQEGVEEAQAYALVVLDLLSRTNGGIVPQYLDPDKGMEITSLSFDEKTRECRIGVAKSGEMAIFTHYRRPNKLLWNGKPLDRRLWRYDAGRGMIRLNLSGEGELTVSVVGPPPKDKWKPIDYIGLDKGPVW